MSEEQWKRLDEDCFSLPLSKLRGPLPLGYEVYEGDDGRVILQVGKGVAFCGRPMHHTYWKFHGWLKDDVVHFGDWWREDEMAPGWGGPATIGFGFFLDDEDGPSVFDEESHETDWEQALEELPYIIEEVLS